jgi:carbon monoxide dehydrogenase subunit G
VVEVTVNIRRTLSVGWDADRALALVADVPKSAAHFPGLERLDDLGDGVFRWNMNPFQVSKFRHQVRYSAQYITDTTNRIVVWNTIGQDNNTTADGRWTVVSEGTGTRLEFENRLVVRMPVPRLASRVVKALVPKITDRETRIYLERIAATMDGKLVAG